MDLRHTFNRAEHKAGRALRGKPNWMDAHTALTAIKCLEESSGCTALTVLDTGSASLDDVAGPAPTETLMILQGPGVLRLWKGCDLLAQEAAPGALGP